MRPHDFSPEVLHGSWGKVSPSKLSGLGFSGAHSTRDSEVVLLVSVNVNVGTMEEELGKSEIDGAEDAPGAVGLYVGIADEADPPVLVGGTVPDMGVVEFAPVAVGGNVPPTGAEESPDAVGA